VLNRVAAFVLFALTAAILIVTWSSTTNECQPDSLWTTWYWENFPFYVLPTTLTFVGGTYFLARAKGVRLWLALACVPVALVAGGFAIWFLAVLDGLAACPP
jgi:hypothetical protein